MLTIYKASAGSGKTYNLAYEYIKALLTIKNKETGLYRLNHKKYATPLAMRTFDHDISGYIHNRHRAILAITFTNKATEEMKTRIIRELSALTVTDPKPDGSDPSPYAAKLIDTTGCSRDELAQSAQTALTDLLYDYHFFNVSTIDSFFQNVLRTFARELDRPGDFDLEIEDRYAIESGVDMMLDDFNFGVVGENSRIGEWIHQFMLDCVEQGEQFNFLNRKSKLHSSLVKFAMKMSSESFKAIAAPLREYLDRSDREGLLPRYCKSLKTRRLAIVENVKALANSAVAELTALGIGPDGYNNTLKARIEKCMLAGIVPAPKDMDITSATFEEVLSNTVSKPSFYLKSSFANNMGAILVMKKLFVSAYKLYNEHWILSQMSSSAQKMIMLGYVWNYVDRFRNENNLVLLSDTNDLLERIIDRSETPFIYEKLGVELNHFLIDEFQDTSSMQWQNLKPLVATGLDEENDSLIIGDEKQSIYRFRNSDSSLLHHKVAQDDFPTRHTIRGRELSENTNYRSSPDVIRFNNSLFSALAPMFNADGYENVIQDIPSHHLDMPGYIRFHAVNNEENPLDLAAMEIIRMHDQGKYMWKDIAVLVNNHLNGNDVVTHLLKNYPQIPIASDESLLLNRSKSVNTVISVMKIIDRIYQAEKPTVDNEPRFPDKRDITFMINRFDFFYSTGIPADEALTMALDPAKSITSDKTETLAQSKSIVSNIENILSHRPSTIVALAEVIIAEAIPPADRDADMAYLVALQDVIIDFNTRHSGDLRTFLRWWDGNNDDLKVPTSPTQDAVRVMTIHKSKGLEFGCVVLPFASWSVSMKNEEIWVDTPDFDDIDNYLKPPVILIPNNSVYTATAPSLAKIFEENHRAQRNDYLNKTYVAYTRPINELVAFYKPGKDIGKLLVEAFENPGAVNDHGRPDLFIDLSEHFDPETKHLTIGKPTLNPAYSESGVADTNDSENTKLHYNVVFRSDTREITAIESQASDPANILSQPLDAPQLIDDDGVDDDSTPLYTRLTPTALGIDEEATRRGNILHDALSHVRHRDDVPRAMQRTARRFRLSPQEHTTMLDIINTAFDSNTLKFNEINRWFNDFAECRNEQTVYDPARDEMKRIDRLVTLPDGTIEIIDFKFTSADNLPEHRLQVTGYVNLLKRMGHKHVIGYLWYPLLESIVPV